MRPKIKTYKNRWERLTEKSEIIPQNGNYQTQGGRQKPKSKYTGGSFFNSKDGESAIPGGGGSV